MGVNSAFKGFKIVKNSGNGRLNNLNDPNRPQCVNTNKSTEHKTVVCACTEN